MFEFVKYVPEFPTYGNEMKQLVAHLNANDLAMTYRDGMRAWIDFSQSRETNFLDVTEENVKAFIEWLRKQDNAFFQEWMA